MNLQNLSQGNLSESHRFELLHPVTGEGLGAYVSVVSAKSDQAQKFVAKQMRLAQKQEFENARSRKPKIKELDEIREESVELAISRIVGWENIEWGDKKDLPFTPENARMVLEQCDWIIEQVLEQSNDLGKFLVS
ncbi:hypothetical protein ABWE90_01120 [Pasteurella multocida]|uniref:hypothetical protein n=1 Tax=Pasteurella multocida TaxID=747 RepID=UPI0002569D15|nr:hypothetical protein [Pasteurella multocida]AFF25327.1 hypothetical protein PMCN06_2102 [Pasteurella multocida subsp. multocida str. HN06]ARB76506.1 hypothetical protein A6J57_09830 [Pasteurella multocida]AUK48908.1 hypothetical protein A4210_03785 [Pasteurella multocida]AUK53516.1 hypothetical protein A4204_03790 [Pasteurella multocida]EJZ80265.1 hypothetical protein P1059_00703 [Pasteurella multocida subsp. gallicida P1059]